MKMTDEPMERKNGGEGIIMIHCSEYSKKGQITRTRNNHDL